MSKNTLVVALLAVVLCGTLFVGATAAQQSSSQELPEESEVGTNVEATFEITELFDEYESWTLAAGTELENATWTIREYNQAGDEISREDLDGQNVTTQVDIEDGTASIEIQVAGTTPAIEQFSYQPPDRFAVAAFDLEREGGTSEEIVVHESRHYTEDSQAARAAIDDASDVVGDSGSSDAQSSLDSAISAYESGNFENAIDLAERAESEASQSQTTRNALLGAGALVVVLLVLGGGYWLYKSRQQGPSRLK
jgi:hypothetical protein